MPAVAHQHQHQHQHQQQYQQPQQQYQQQQQQNPFDNNDSHVDEVESGTGYKIHSWVPKFDSKPNVPSIAAPSADEVNKLLSEAESISSRATAGERKAAEAAQIHSELKRQAEEMLANTGILEREAQAKEQALLFEREQLRKEEEELESIRASKHNEVLQKEALRAQAKADVLLQQKKHEHAGKLIQRHQEGLDLALAEVQRCRLEKQEADLLRQRAELIRAKKPVSRWIPTEIQPIKVLVDVEPENIPEAHVPSNIVTEGAHAGSLIGTRMVPERPLMQQAKAQAGTSQFKSGMQEQTPDTMPIERGGVVSGNKTFAGDLIEEPVQHSWRGQTH